MTNRLSRARYAPSRAGWTCSPRRPRLIRKLGFKKKVLTVHAIGGQPHVEGMTICGSCSRTRQSRFSRFVVGPTRDRPRGCSGPSARDARHGCLRRRQPRYALTGGRFHPVSHDSWRPTFRGRCGLPYRSSPRAQWRRRASTCERWRATPRPAPPMMLHTGGGGAYFLWARRKRTRRRAARRRVGAAGPDYRGVRLC